MPAKRNSVSLHPAPMVSLFLILIAIVAAVPAPSSGHIADVAFPDNGVGVCNNRMVVAQVWSDGRVLLNQEDVKLGNLGNRLTQIFRTRAERLIFISPDRDATFGQVTTIVDIAKTELDRVASFTPAVQHESGSCGPILTSRRPVGY
jgi:biopolymer transport protein TolR